jgi:hypothetical protein
MNKLYMNRFAVTDIGNVCWMIIEEAGKCVIPEAKTHESFAHLSVCYGEFKGSLLRDKASEKTSKTRAADKRRDDAVVGLFVSLDGMFYSPNAVKRGKAEVLSSRLSKFRGIQAEPDSKETTDMQSLITTLDEPENAQLVKDLMLEEFVVEIKAAEAEFENLWSDRETDVAEFRNSQSATTLRRNVEYAVNRYFDYVTINAEFSGKPEWRQLQQEIYSRYLTIRQKYQTATKPDETKDTK